MPRFARKLTAFDSTPAADADPPEAVNFQSDLIVILAALLCALICLVGVFAVGRCAWLRRRRRSSSVSSPDPSQASANKGLKKKILNSLPKFTYGATAATVGGGCCKFELTECAICLGEFSEGDAVRVLPLCGHGFHVGCIDKWLESHSSCPSCRQIIVVVATCQKCGQFLDPAVSSSSSSSSSNCGCGAVVVADCQPCKDNNHNNNRNHLVNVGFCLDKSQK